MKPSTRNFLLLTALLLAALSVFVYRNKIDTDATICLNRGRAELANGNLDGALDAFNKAIELKPDYAAAYGDLGIVKQSKGDLDGALADLNKAIEIKPDYAGAYLARGFVKRRKGDLDGALADLNNAITFTTNVVQDDSDPALAEFKASVYANRGEVKQTKGDLDGALADFNKCLELNPNNPKFSITYANRGVVKFAKGDFVDAQADFKKAIELDSKMEKAIAAKGYFVSTTNWQDAGKLNMIPSTNLELRGTRHPGSTSNQSYQP